ncbi:hypothetical protein MMC19_007465 [Ptychographa xylographoides]|nr:hypothetical protein [Ptychographa xylographoides]
MDLVWISDDPTAATTVSTMIAIYGSFSERLMVNGMTTLEGFERNVIFAGIEGVVEVGLNLASIDAVSRIGFGFTGEYIIIRLGFRFTAIDIVDVVPIV